MVLVFVCLISLNIMFSRSIYVVTIGRISSFLRLNDIPHLLLRLNDIPHLLYLLGDTWSSVDRYSHCPHVLAIVLHSHIIHSSQTVEII